jgi:hypothetical protein
MALLPFGMVRDRLAGTAVEAHQVAGMAAVPASSVSSAGATETLTAAALAVVAVLGGVAGGARGGDHQRRATAAPAALTAEPMGSATSRTHLTAPPPVRDRPERRSGRARGPVALQPQAPAPVLQQVIPPVAPAPPVPPPPVAPQVAAPLSDQGTQVLLAPTPTPDGAATGVQQQSLASQPAGSGAGLTQSPTAGSQNGPVTTSPAPPAQGAPAPQAGLVKPRPPVSKRPPAVKRPPAKPGTPVAPPSGPGSRPGINPGPASAPGRAQKAPAATAKPVPPKQKKNGPAATRVAKPL